MFKIAPWIVKSVASWLKQTRLWDCFYWYCIDGWDGARQAALDFVTHRSRPKKSYVLEASELEPRIVPDANPLVLVSITSPGPEMSHVGSAVSLQVQATSAVNDPLVFDAQGLPAGLSINRHSGLISGTPLLVSDANSPFQVSVTATDPCPRAYSVVSATATFSWAVAASAGVSNQGLDPPPAIDSMTNQPIAFELNVGQTDEQVKFLSRGPGYNLFLTNDQAVLTLARPQAQATEDPQGRIRGEAPITQDVVGISFVGANEDTRVVPSGELSQRTNYFLGSQGFADVPNYSRVRVEDLYDGVGVEYYGNQQGALEYDLIVAPGANLSQVRMKYQGVEQIHADANGNLILQTAGGEITQQAPILYQKAANGSRQNVSGRFILRGQDEIGFEADEYDPNRPLIVDPTLVYGTYLGGSSNDSGYAIAADLDGSAYVTGTTVSSAFPTLNPFQSTYNGGTDAFVSKFDPTGQLIYSTYLGGTGLTGPEQGNGIAVDLSGSVYVTGQTKSSDFPTTVGAYDTTMNGSSSGFIAKLNTTGDALIYSTFVDYSTPHAIAVNLAGEAFIAGEAISSFSTTGSAYQTTFGGGGFSPTDAFLLKLNAAGSSRSYATFLGGSTDEVAYGVAVDADGEAYVAGSVSMGISVNYPTTGGAYQTSFGGGTGDVFVTKVNSSGTGLSYSTLIGGSGNEAAYGIALNGSDQAYITGFAADPLFGTAYPTTGGAYQTSYSNSRDAFVTELNSSGTSLVFSTFAGGSGADTGRGIALASGGDVAITGDSGSGSATVTRVNSTGTSLVYASTLATGTGYGIADDPLGNLYLTGETTGSLSTTPGAFQTSVAGGSDAYAIKIGIGVARPVIESVDDDNGDSGTDGITSDTTLTIAGVAPASSTVKLYVAGNYLDSTTADGGGDWTYIDTFAEGVYSLTATATDGGLTSNFSKPFVFTVDATAPDVTLVVPATSYTLAPRVEVYATDIVGIADGATVSIDVDLDGNNAFAGGELGFGTGTLVNGYVLIQMPALLAGDMDMRAHVTDIAGNQGTSAVETTNIITVVSPWALTGTGNDGVIIAEAADSSPLLQLGALRLAHVLDLDQSPGAGQSGNPALVYNSNLTHVRPIVQATIQLDNAVSLPGTITATLTWDGVTQTGVNFSTSALALGDDITIGAQVDSPVSATGRYAWSLSLSALGYTPIVLSGSTYVRVEDDSPFGAGWTFAPVNRLFDIPNDSSGTAGQLMLLGDGGTRFFGATSGTLASPPEDNGTLIRNTDEFDISSATEVSTTVTITTMSAHNFVVGQKVAIAGISPIGYCGIVTVTAVTSTTFTYTAAASLGTATLTSAIADGFPVPVTISAASETGNTVTITTSSAHGLSVGEDVTIAGITPAGYCGNFTITGVPTSTTFTYYAPSGLGTATLSSPTVTGCPYTYRTPENVRLHFNVDGYQTDWVSGDGLQRIVYTYTGTNLTGITAIDGASTTLTYGSLLSAIDTAGSRSWTVTHSGINLSQITDPDGLERDFTYDGNNHITDDTRDTLVNHWHYSGELVDQFRWGNGSSPSTTSIVSVASDGLASLFVGPPVAISTDALGYVTVSAFDTKGRLVKQTNPDGGISTWGRDGAGRIEAYIDPLDRLTTYTHDGDGYLTSQTNPDATTRTWDFYSNIYHSLQTFTDENSHTTDYTIDSDNGHILTITNAAGKVTTNTYYTTIGLLETITDPATRVVTLVYDSYRRLETSTDVLGTTTYDFDTTTGEINFIEDANTHETTMTFDEMGRMLTRTTPDTFEESWVYNDAGLLETHTDKEGVGDKRIYDPFGRGLVASFVEASGKGLERTTLTYFDDAGRAVGSRNPLGFSSFVTLDSMGRSVKAEDAEQNVTLSNYDRAGQLKGSRDALGSWTTYVYNDRGWVEETTDARGKTWLTGYDYVGNVTSSTDPNGHETDTEYDELDRVYSVTDPEFHTSYTTYWDDNRLKDQTDPRGEITRTTWNLESYEILVTHALGTAKERTYTKTIDFVGNILSIEDPNGHLTTNVIDEMDRVKETDDNAGHGDEYTFNNNGAVIKIEDELGKDTSFSIDDLGRMFETEDPSGIGAHTFFNANDEETADEDDEGHLSREIRNRIGEAIVSIDARGFQTKMVYNANGWLIAYVDPLGNKTSYEYDKGGNKTKEIDPLGQERAWVYDDADQLETYTDKNGREKDFTYYDNGLLETETWKDDLGATVNVKEFDYNEDDQLTEATDYSGTYEWTYDDLCRVETITDPNGFILTYDYDLADRLESITDSLGGETDFTYDSADRIDTRSFTDGLSSLGLAYHFNDRNDLEEIDRYDDNPTLVGKTLFTYFDNRQVESITHKDGSNVLIDDFNYTYDDVGNVATETSHLGPSRTYAYDEDNQLKDNGTDSYDWDANGNNTDFTPGDGANQIASDGTWDYTYDDEGNVTEKVNSGTDEIWLYGYDNDNRLVLAEHKPDGVSAVDLRVEFGYDVLNNRIQKSVDADGDSGGSATILKFAYDPYGNAYVDFTGASTIVARHVFGDGQDALIARIEGGDTTWYGQDNLGSTRDLFDGSGAPIDHLDYNSFGKLTYESASGSDRYLYTSREYDAEIDLQYNRARYYDANTQRWISQDPLGFDAGDSNLYRYVNNRPTGATDPSGLQDQDWRNPSDWTRNWSNLLNEHDKRTKMLNAMKTQTAGKWDATSYFDSRISTSGLTVPARPRDPNSTTGGYSIEWQLYRRGCIGLCRIRMGMVDGEAPQLQAEKSFTTYEAANKYMDQRRAAKTGKQYRMFAVLFKNLKNMTEKEFNNSKEVNAQALRIENPYDYCSLIRPTKDEKTWYWESMSGPYFDPDRPKGEIPKVVHRPFREFISDKNVRSNRHVIYCVTEIRATANRPPDATER